MRCVQLIQFCCLYTHSCVKVAAPILNISIKQNITNYNIESFYATNKFFLYKSLKVNLLKPSL